jgi:transcription termination/antitermination protein NusA
MAMVPKSTKIKLKKPKRKSTMANTAVSANRLELLQIADAVAREKSIDKAVVLEAMEDAITRAAKARYGVENEIRAEIDPKSGETRLNRLLMVVEVIDNDATQISLKEASKKNPAAQVGDYIAEPLPPIEFGRIAAQSAKQVIVQKVRDAERDRMYDEFKDRIGEIVNGTVKRAEYGNVIVDLGKGEGIVRRDEALPRETFRPGDRIRAYVYDVRREQRGPQIFLSRTHPQFMAKLFGQEVPEIYDGVVEVVSVARDPGSRAKIGVRSKDGSIDPVGACVGMRGSRVQAVVNELQGEKIDIIQWSADVATFVVNALAPAEVAKVVLDEDVERIEVVVPDEQLSLAIGRRGQKPKSRSAARRNSPRAPRLSWMRWMWTKLSPSFWHRKASRRLRNWFQSKPQRSPPSTALMMQRRKSCNRGPPLSLKSRRRNLRPNAMRWVCRTILPVLLV